MKHKEEINLIRKMLDKVKDRQKYYRDSIIEYYYLPKSITRLPFGIYIDDGYAYTNNQHPLWLYVYTNDKMLIPVTIEDNPQVIDGMIDDNCFKSLCLFIKLHKDELITIADGDMDSSDFTRILKLPLEKVVESTNPSLLNEMGRIDKKITGLPCDIYVDNGPIHSGHEDSPHLKFPPSRDVKLSTEFVTMLISESPDIAPDQKEKYGWVKGKLKRTIQSFIINNLDVLTQQFRGEITVDELKDILRSRRYNGK